MVYKSNCISYTSNEKFNNENKNIILFTLPSKSPKHLGIHVIREMQEVYPQNYKTWMRSIKEDLSKCREITCLWIRRLNIVKIVILQLTYRFNTISS